MIRKALYIAIKTTAVALLFSGGILAAEPQTVTSLREVKWAAAPAMLPSGAMMAVMAGDPAATGLVTLRLKMPAGYRIPAHWHPTDEHVTVLSGTFSIGMGDKLDPAKCQDYKAGGYAVAPAYMNHFAWTKTGGTIEVNLMGPFELTYVNPGDDPRGAKAK